MSACCGFDGGGFGGSSGATSTTTAGGLYAPPEAWARNRILANQLNVTMAALVSQNFNTIKMVRPGWVVGLVTRLTTPVLTGQVTVEATLNGLGTGFSLVHTNALNSTGGIRTQGVGFTIYAAGDLLGMRLTSTINFTPVNAGIEAWLQLFEIVP